MAGRAHEDAPDWTRHPRVAGPFPSDLVRLRPPFAARHARAFPVRDLFEETMQPHHLPPSGTETPGKGEMTSIRPAVSSDLEAVRSFDVIANRRARSQLLVWLSLVDPVG